MLIATITTQRSGSKFLASCFQAGTAVSPFGEVFNPDIYLAGSFHLFKEADSQIRSGDTGLGYMDRYFGSLEALRVIAQFDVMFNQIEIPAITWNPYSTFFLYGILRAAGAIVVHLERDAADTYLSMKYLEASGAASAHNYASNNSSIDRVAPAWLDYSDFERYRGFHAWHRDQLREAMKDYPLFYHLSYEALVDAGGVPNGLRELIVEEAAKRKISISHQSVQYEAARVFRSNVDYRSTFSNYEKFAEECLG